MSNQNNPYMTNMASMGGINPSQIPPALYQQFLQQQQNQQQQPNPPQQQQFTQMMNNVNPNPAQNSMGFNGLHQAYQRIQSQEAAKLEQQRLGMGIPGTAAPGQYQQLLALQGQGGTQSPNINGMMGNFGYPQQGGQQMPQIQQPQQQPNQMNMGGQGQNMGQNGNMQLSLAQIQQILQQQQQQQQQGGQVGQVGQGSNALGMGGMNQHSQSQGLNLSTGAGDSEQGRRQALQSMLQTQGMPAANLYPNQPQQFQPSPNTQNAQMPLPPNNQPNQPTNNTAQQLEAFFRSHPEMEKGDRAQALNQFMMRAKNSGTNINMGSLTQNPQQQQRPHPVGLNGFTPQPQVQNMGQQAQRIPNQNQQTPQMQQNAQPQMQQNAQPQMQQNAQPQMPRSDSFNPAQAQQNMQYPGAGDTQRQIEAAMKQRQRTGLVTPQQNNGSALPLPSPQPGQSMQQQQQQLPGGITPSQHHRSLSQSSSIHPPIPQPPPQQQQQQQAQAANIFNLVQGWTDDHLEKATASMLSKVVGATNQHQATQGKTTIMQMVAEFKRRLMQVPQPLLDGLEKVFPGNVGQLMSLDHAALQNVVWNQLKSSTARQMQSQQQVAMQQSQNRQMQTQMGTQANPVDITTPQIQPTLQHNVPSFAQQPAANFAPPPQRQSSQGPGSGQTNPNPQWQQQQQLQHSANRGKAWAGHDFSKTPFPIPEDKFLPYLLQMLNIPNFAPPTILNRTVDLYALFNLVHKNGGSVKLEGNLAAWSQIAALLGFGEQTQSGPSPRSNPQIAMQIAKVHATFLSRLEDMFYQSQLNERMKAQGGQNSQQQPQMSNQFLEAVARGGNGLLNEQQKKALEGRKQTPGALGQQRQTPQGADVGLLQAMRQNPKMAVFWVKSKEESMRQRLLDPSRGTKFTTVPDEVKAKAMADLQGLPQLAADAQHKMPKMFMVAVERATNPTINAASNDDANLLVNVIQFYTTIQVITGQAAQDKYMATPPDLSMLRDRITSILNRFSNCMSEMLSNPDTAPSLTRLLAAVEQPPSSVGAGARQSPAMEELASKLPKGLRVEDLKPPPSKRQKGKSGQSPAMQGQTPDPKTPSIAADSPAGMPGSANSKKPMAVGNKRKRQTSNAAALSKTPKFLAPAIPKIETASTEDIRHKAFFEAQAALANGTADPWSALTSAMEEYEKADAVKPSTSVATASKPPVRSDPTDDELFAQFMDLDNTHFPTPELLSDLVDDYSPESIRTVGRGESVFHSVRANPIKLEEETKDLEEDDGYTYISVPQSPGSAAYNGGLIFG